MMSVWPGCRGPSSSYSGTVAIPNLSPGSPGGGVVMSDGSMMSGLDCCTGLAPNVSVGGESWTSSTSGASHGGESVDHLV